MQRKFKFKSLFLVVYVLLSVTVFFGHAIAADGAGVKAAYDEYLKNYKEFKDAVDKNVDPDKLKEYADKYKKALENYKKLLNDAKSILNNKSEEKNTTDGADGKTSETIDTAQGANTSGSLQEIVNQLHTSGAKTRIDQVITRLENFIKTSQNGEEINTAKIELANAYAKFRQDYTKSVQLLQEVANETKNATTSADAQRALVRAKFLQEKAKLAGIVSKARAAAQSKDQEYKQISWKNPIKKISALGSYYKTLFSYRSAMSDYRSCKEDGEKDLRNVSYEFLSDVFGKRSEFNVSDTFDNTSLNNHDAAAQVRLITDNNEAWYARWYMLNCAKQTIDMTYFIFEKDAYGKAMLGLLMKKAREGVKIRLMIDARGSKSLAKTFLSQDYLQKLAAEPNVQIKVFNPLHKNLIAIVENIRNLIGSNHQKIIIVDGELSITGGRNVSLNYFADPRDNSTVFRDSDVLLKGSEIAGQMRAVFEEEFDALNNFDISKDLLGDWSKRSEELIAAEKSMDMWIKGQGVYQHPKLKEVNAELSTYKHMVNYGSYNPFEGSFFAPVKLYGKTNYQDDTNSITDNIIALMDASSDEIIIQNPYVILTEKSREALKRASARGVKVIIHTNSPVSTDSILTQAFFLEDWKTFMKEVPTARVFVFAGQNKLHAKVFMFDSTIAAVGTYNMDYMSEQINGENVCAVKSPEFAKECRERTFKDISVSKEYKIGIDKDGNPYEIYGPGQFTSKKTMFILETLMKLKIIKPLI